MVIVLILLAVIMGGIYLFMQQKPFGTEPSGARLERIKRSPNYRDGSFQNQHPTEVMSKDVSYLTVMKAYFKHVDNKEPAKALPSVKSDLKHSSTDKPVITWFGHSSYFIQVSGKNILIDPVFSGNVSPVSFFGKNYAGSNVYSVDDFPDLDMVIITHDHYDHLDYPTIVKLKDKTKHFYTSLGVGAHLAYWGVEESRITEFDWWDEVAVDSSMKLIAAPARHFSGRKFKRGQTLWASYILQAPGCNIYLGGDSGYDTHFKEIGEKYGPFDLALLECGQYNAYWPSIHMMPEETAQAAIDLKAKTLMPVHWSKFTLSLHPWNEPVNRVTAAAKKLNLPVTTPMIGEQVVIDSLYPVEHWW